MTDQELKDLVASFAVDRKETGKLIDRLAKEADARQKKADEEIAAIQARTAAIQARIIATEERTTARQEKNALEMEKFNKEFNEKLEKISEQIGGIGNNIGHHAEQFFQNVFKEKLEFGRIKYDEMIPNLTHKSKKDEIEFDIALINGDSIALIEVKNRIHPNFVIKFAEERVEKFREYFHEFENYDVYLGIAGFSFSDEVLDRASAYGIGIVRQVGESIEIDANNLKVY
jgi:DNA repair exonuclease SbcCD ATPase subunit